MIRKIKSGYRLYSRKKNPKTGKRRNLGARLKRAEISSFPCLRIFLSRIQSITGFNFSDHDSLLSGGNTMPVLPARVSIVKVFKSTLAGPLVTFPVRTSKHELCHGHCTLKPSKSPSESGPKRWVQNS